MVIHTAKSLALAAVALGAAWSFARHGTAGAAGPAVAVAPASASAVAGGDVTLDITVDAVGDPGLGGYLIVLKWDPAVLSLASIADSGWVTGGDIIVVCTAPTIDNTGGNAEIDCTPVLAFGSGVTTASTQTLAQAVFHANSAGTTSIDLGGSYLLNPSNVTIAPTLANGAVNVTAAPTSTAEAATATVAATGTPAPTATASATSGATFSATARTEATANVAASSTNAAGATLSNVEAPQAGSGSGNGGSDRTAWWVAGIAATAAALAGGTAAYEWRRSRNRRGRT